ncbi:MAG: PEP-CTERM sorting domain-containing protein [Steroidobacteraceae bacterium]
MKAKTARPYLLVMLFGFLASHGWMITEYGPGTGAPGVAPPSAARGTPEPAVRERAAAAPAVWALQPSTGATVPPAARTQRPDEGAAAAREGLRADSAAMLAATTPGSPETAWPSDPASDLTFSGATNLISGPVGGSAAPADPPVVGAQPSLGASAPPPISGGAPEAKELAEPGSLALLVAGLIVLGWMRRRARAV